MNFKEILEIELTPEQSLMAEMNSTGDTRVIWNRNNPDEVSIAQSSFEKARQKGMMAYKVTGKEGTRGEIMHSFDPEAERIILAPPLRGGRDVGVR